MPFPFRFDRLAGSYLDALNYKWETIGYHLDQLREMKDNPNALTAIRANFDGVMFQLHTTHDLVAQMVNQFLKIGLNESDVSLSKVRNRMMTTSTACSAVHQALDALHEGTHYTRDYVNYSKHRNIIKVIQTHLTFFLSPSFPALMHVVTVEGFEKSVSRPHDGGSPITITQREVDATRDLIETVLGEVKQCLS